MHVLMYDLYIMWKSPRPPVHLSVRNAFFYSAYPYTWHHAFTGKIRLLVKLSTWWVLKLRNSSCFCRWATHFGLHQFRWEEFDIDTTAGHRWIRPLQKKKKIIENNLLIVIVIEIYLKITSQLYLSLWSSSLKKLISIISTKFSH